MSALIVGAILAAAAIVCFLVMRSELRGQVDDALRDQAQLVARAPRLEGTGPRIRVRPPRARSGVTAPFLQFISTGGTVTRTLRQDPALPVDATDRRIARTGAGPALRDSRADGKHLRVMTVPIGTQGALQLARSLDPIDSVLGRLRLLLAALVVGGTGLAIALSRLFSRPVIAPISDLTGTAEHIEATGDLRRRVGAGRDDEVGRLAHSFNAMLDRVQRTQDALEASTAAQRQLVADASHELRTPVTSLRTNIEVLLASDDIEEHERRALLHDVVEQSGELSALVSDLIELARDDQPREHTEEVELSAIVRDALVRARRHAPQLHFAADIEPCWTMGSPERVARAVNNVLDNAAKFSPAGSTVEAALGGDGTLVIRDRGPGVPAEEVPHVFDRFYRGRSAADFQGSGLGLAIVRQVMQRHGGQVDARNRGGGGLAVRLRFPPVDVAPQPVLPSVNAQPV
jgi:two-component system sensor histidine kinase MprB